MVDWLVGQLAHWLAGASAYMPVPWLVGRMVNVFGCHRNGEQNPVEWGQISYVHPSVQAKDRPKATVKNNTQGVADRSNLWGSQFDYSKPNHEGEMCIFLGLWLRGQVCV